MIAIIDYEMGNPGSILNMLRKRGHDAMITHDEQSIAGADKLILPGVGAFDHGMKMLRKSGLDELLRKTVLEHKVPILGICLGMQLFAQASEEGNESGLGWINANVTKFGSREADFTLKIPHMGWNEVAVTRDTPLFAGLHNDARFYFVHSYHMECADHGDVCATAHYGYDFTAAVHRDNIYGTQFHPEKSHRYGLSLLSAFVERAQ